MFDPQASNLDAKSLQPGSQKLCLLRLLGVVLCLLGLAAQAQPSTPGELTGDYNEAYYVLSDLNAGLDAPLDAPNLQTPQGTLEFFLRAARSGDYARAAHALNLNLLPVTEQRAVAASQAEKLHYLLEDKRVINFDALPDRPDGQTPALPGGSNPLAGQPRRSLELGSISLNGRALPLSVQRVRVAEGAPAWVFSANTVDNINALYDEHGPNWLERNLPDWTTARVFFGIALWEVVALIGLIVLAVLLGVSAARLSGWVTRHTGSDAAGDLVSKLAGPIGLSIVFGFLFALTSGVLPFTDALVGFVHPLMWVLFVGALIWLGVSTINYFAERYREVEIEHLDDEQKEAQRKRRTIISVGRRAFIFVALLVGVGVMLSQFVDLQVLGTTLLTSAGIAGAVVGIAAQPTIGNIIAGVQVAITQPVRIGDTIMYDGQWSTVEDLRYTYAVILTWDERRLIVPMRDLITETIENWSHTDPHQAGAVYLFVDYDTDIAALRDKFSDVVKAHELWDGETEPEMLTYSVDDDGVKLRGKVAAANPDKAWSLECDIREQMLAHLSELKEGRYLPRERLELHNAS